MKRSIFWGLIAALALPWTTAADTPQKATLLGIYQSDGVTGQSAWRHGWLEVPIYAQSESSGVGLGVRTGSNPQGGFEMTAGKDGFPGFAAGSYSLFGLSYSEIPAFTVRRGVTLGKQGANSKADLVSPAHYSVMYDAQPVQWGPSPYSTNGTDFYQTFLAKGKHITRIGVKLAGKGGDHQELTLNFAVYQVNSKNPRTWKRVSPIRSRLFGKGVDPIIHIYHVIYRSNEVKLIPGNRYAARFWRDPASPSPDFTLAVLKDTGRGYTNGELYQDGKPMRDLDAYAYISGGEHGTVVNHAPIGNLDLKDYSGSAKRFGQTFTASGSGLAGVDIVYADGKVLPSSYPVKFQLFDKPGGKAIGPAKTCYGCPLTYQARAAAIWNKGEVMLKPGKVYYMQWSFPHAVNSWILNEKLPGSAYLDGKPKPEADMAMSIAEYER